MKIKLTLEPNTLAEALALLTEREDNARAIFFVTWDIKLYVFDWTVRHLIALCVLAHGFENQQWVWKQLMFKMEPQQPLCKRTQEQNTNTSPSTWFDIYPQASQMNRTIRPMPGCRHKGQRTADSSHQHNDTGWQNTHWRLHAFDRTFQHFCNTHRIKSYKIINPVAFRPGQGAVTPFAFSRSVNDWRLPTRLQR